MSTEIKNLMAGQPMAKIYTKTFEQSAQDRPEVKPTSTVRLTEPDVPQEHLKVLHADIAKIVEDLQKVSDTFNRKLDFEINQESGQLIVRILNGDTGEVIKVLPPKELQNLHMRIKETVGLLVDETM